MTSFKDLFIRPFLHYIPHIENNLKNSIHSLGPKSLLRDACEYALCNGGKRIRPSIVLMVAEALGKENVNEAALAVEYFHTASLIADDLPSMDNDEMRRDQPTLHKAFNEATALLTTYALISAGYEKIRLNAKNSERLSHALECATRTTGILGATGGQYLDLFPPLPSEDVLKETLDKKTGSLFELSFVLGWIYGGGCLEKVPLVQKASFHFGYAFQILDDFHDYEKDSLNKHKINAVVILGKKRALSLLENESYEFCRSVEQLSLNIPQLTMLIASFPAMTLG